MAANRCGLCGRTAPPEELVAFRGLKGWVCRNGHGCDRDHPALAAVRRWLAGPDSGVSDAELDDLYIDNPPQVVPPKST